MCDLQSLNPVPAKPGTGSRASHACTPPAGMHWVREEGFQGLRARSLEIGEQFTCPLCRQPVAFARKYNIC